MENELVKKLLGLPFIKDVEKVGGEVYAVGGPVRDHLLGLESKDLDILVRGISQESLLDILHKYGKVDLVGKSFGIIKFKAPNCEEIDIALPRKEVKTGDKHTDFDVIIDPYMGLDEDLERRDFTINAMAMDTDGLIHDPFNGLKDIDDKLIKVVKKNAFKEDPLRMLRAIQFASRFPGFDLSENTKGAIIMNQKRMVHVSGERIIIELEKIIEKGDIYKAIRLIINTDVFYSIYGYTINKYICADIDEFKTLSDLLYFFDSDIDLTIKRLKPSKQVIKELRAIRYLDYTGDYSASNVKIAIFNLMHKCPEILNVGYFKAKKEYVKSLILEEFKEGKYPTTLSEIAIDGNDLVALGLEGKEVGKAFRFIVKNIFKDNINNNKEEILNLIKTKYEIS